YPQGARHRRAVAADGPRGALGSVADVRATALLDGQGVNLRSAIHHGESEERLLRRAPPAHEARAGGNLHLTPLRAAPTARLQPPSRLAPTALRRRPPRHPPAPRPQRPAVAGCRTHRP